MIVILHNKNSIVKVLNDKLEDLNFNINESLISTFYSLAKSYPDDLILWCHEAYFKYVNFKKMDQIFHHPKMMVSYSVANKKYLSEQIGYIEDSPFINVKFNVSYPTWLMSSDVGGVHACVLNAINPNHFPTKKINLFLNSLAKSVMSSGLLCYSNPNLLVENLEPKIPVERVSNLDLYVFTRQYYKKKWLFFLFISQLFFENKFSIFSLITSFFHSRTNVDATALDAIEAISKLKTDITGSIDVIIPTIGRKKYLYDVLKDLAAQTVLPERIIIIEQNPEVNSNSELDYISTMDWPFIIDHHFIHKTGACNARNLAIAETRSNWVFFADDDNRLQPDTLEQALKILTELGAKVITSSYLQKNEKKTDLTIKQWSTFGAGNSFIQGDVARSIKFDLSFEHGYGEDKDYGMKLRNSGVDVIYHPFDILHLKAPIGGFRKPIINPWESEDIIPKPSPTILLFRLKHTTKQQLLAYKLQLFIKFYKKQSVRNPIVYIKKMNKAWKSSINWANKLAER